MDKKFNYEEFIKSFNVIGVVEDKILFEKDIHDAIKFAKNTYSFDMLKNITAVDKQEQGIEIIYHLYSTDNNENVRFSITLQDECESVTDIFKSAQADENEIYDMFGIKFLGNESLKRLYMPESWQGFPLKKDYVQDDTRLAWNDSSKDV